jgi:hypothetical protein
MDYLGDVEDCPIVDWDFSVSCHEQVASSSAARFGFGEVLRVAVNCEDHVACTEGEYGFLLCCHEIQKFLAQDH